MVNVADLNGAGEAPAIEVLAPPTLPEVLHINAADSGRVPSPGTLRALKALTGKGWEELMGPEADAADRFQTIIWSKLRRDIPGLSWDACADVELEIDGGPPVVDPLELSASGASPRSVDSGE